MSIHHLDHLFHPHTLALIGASVKPHSVGSVVMKNLLNGGFQGTIWPVNPKYDVIEGVTAYASVDALLIRPILPSSPHPHRPFPISYDGWENAAHARPSF